MKILILGGTGLISTHITRLLLERGEEVTLYNRGKRAVEFAERCTSIVGDRNDLPAFEARMAEAGPFDCVIDMICYRAEHAVSALRAFRGRVGQYVFCSTVDVYAKPAGRYPITEAEPRTGSYPYAANKARCEDIFTESHGRDGMRVTIIRPAHTYADAGMILFSLGRSPVQLDRLRKGKPIVVHGDGTSFWVSCRAEEVAGAFCGALGNDRAMGRAYHVAGDEWLTWNRSYEFVAEAMGAPPPALVHIPTEVLGRIAPELARGTVQNFWGNNIFDSAAAKADLGFVQRTRWLEGVGRTIRWLDAHGQIGGADQDHTDDRIIAAWERLVKSLPVAAS